MKKNFKLFIACIICTVLCFSAIGGDFPKTSDVKTTNKVYAAENDGGVIGTVNLNNTAENSAKVGYELTAPEIGWRRYDDTDSRIIYKGSNWIKAANEPTSYNNSEHVSKAPSDSLIFKMYGSKFRLTDLVESSKSTKITVKVDGVIVGNYSSLCKYPQYQTLVYQKTGLTLDIHVVEIINYSSEGGYLGLDAIDIDDTGYLIDQSSNPTTGISLNKTTMTLEKGKTDTETLTATVTPDNATNKKVVWSSSDEKIATVDANGKVTAVSKGKATITAKVDGTDLKATCEVTVTEPAPTPEPSKGRAILEVVMSNNERKEYDLEMTEVNKFVDWYNGNTSPSYQIKINNNVKPFTNRTEYLAHDKISSFQVKEYAEN